MLLALFSELPLLEGLVLDVCKNVGHSSFTFEMLSSKCHNLKVVNLVQFQGICLAIGSRLDEIALCHEIQSLSIICCGDLDDMRLIKIDRGCSRLARFEIQGCKPVTEKRVENYDFLSS